MNFLEYTELTNHIDNNRNWRDNSKYDGKNINLPSCSSFYMQLNSIRTESLVQTHNSNFIFLFKMNSNSKIE